MSKQSNINKSKTLGMPHGTASNKLRKSIMFKYVKLAGDNFCFKCGSEIESVDDISIEHKAPWENISSELFFDLENIAFSHRACNTPDRYFTGPRKIINPDGKICSSCKQFLPYENYHKLSSRYDGTQNTCKDCKSTRDANRVR